MPSFRSGLLLCGMASLLAAAAHAQSNSCELLKQTLAARIPPEIRGYSMDDVPARTPVPSNGKVIGTCEGGARKVIYRRFGGPPLNADGAGAQSAAAAASEATTASAPAVAKAPTVVTPPAAKEAPKAKAEPAMQAKPAPAVPPAASAGATAATTTPPAPASAASAVAPPQLQELKPTDMPSPAAAEPKAESTMPATAAAASDNEPGFFHAYGRWLWLLLALPLAGVLWAWVSHRMAYDSAGLPRGPKL